MVQKIYPRGLIWVLSLMIQILRNKIKILNRYVERKKRACILWFFFLSRKGGDKKSHDHELVIEFLFRIFKQFADKRRITKKLVFLLFKDPHLFLLTYLLSCLDSLYQICHIDTLFHDSKGAPN